MPNSLREAATEFSNRVVENFPTISAICLYGSVARGDDDELSDIDLLILGDDPNLSPSVIRKRIGGGERDRVSIVYHTADTFEDFVTSQNRFLVHIQKEGEVLHDSSGTLRKIQNKPPMKGLVAEEIEGQIDRLRIYEEPSRFNGNYLFPLSHIYSIGKGVVMAILAENEIFEFRRDQAMSAFVEQFPDAELDVLTVRALAPFYAVVSKRAPVELPFAPYGSEAEMVEAVAAVRRLSQYSRAG
jgi:predicted nucleotidyltransferase